MDKKEILLDIIGQQKSWIVAHTIGKIKLNEEGKLYPVLDYKELYYLCGHTGLEEYEFQTSMEEDDWDTILRQENAKEGNYWIYIMYSIQSDSDDYRSWTYYELESVHLEWINSFEEEREEIERRENINDFDFLF